MYLYIIYSRTQDSYYVGITTNLDERIQKHNNHKYARAFTKKAKDWEYVLTKKTKSIEEALYLGNLSKE